jgi:hypothetical protein
MLQKQERAFVANAFTCNVLQSGHQSFRAVSVTALGK